MRPLRSVRQTTLLGPVESADAKTQTKRSTLHTVLSQHRETKARARRPRRSLHTGKVPNGVRWKNLLRRYRVRRLPENTFPWSWRRDLNPRPSDYKSDALPTELRQQIREKDVLSPKPIPLIIARCPGQLFKVSQGELRAQAGYAIAYSNKTVGDLDST
jgi:hypothetical protein